LLVHQRLRPVARRLGLRMLGLPPLVPRELHLVPLLQLLLLQRLAARP